MTSSTLETTLLYLLRANGLPEGETEYRFHPIRRWKFDRAWKEYMLAVELNGAIYTKGRHSTGKGLEGDYEKINEAQIMGWKVLQFSGGQLENGYAISAIKRALECILQETETRSEE